MTMQNIATLMPPRATALVVSLLLLAGCSLVPTAESPLPEPCGTQLRQITQSIDEYGVQDAQYTPIAGFPTYRSSRFWSSFDPATLAPQQERYWRQQLHQMGMDSLEKEWHNLPQQARAQLPAFARFRQQCSTPLFDHSLQLPLTTQQLAIPDSYSDLQRWLGLYALIKYGAAGSIAEYQQEMRARIEGFEPPATATTLFAPATTASTTDLIKGSIPIQSWLEAAYGENPLQVPQLPKAQLQALLQAHAPIVEVAQQSSADKPGAARWQEQEVKGKKQGTLERSIDSDHPTLYTYPSYIRFGDAILLQLNYTLWFSERPKPTDDDWYGGKLDGLVWRVTLQQDGSVLFYDSIHPCGCYHSVHLPTDSPLAELAEADQQEQLEPILFFRNRPANPLHPPKLYLEAGTHYLVNVSQEQPRADTPLKHYQLVNYDQLRDLEAGAGQRNWFDPDGIIHSSARRERYFLWPLGVPSAGAMRQQGHHAIAFVGKRHFDEASVEALLEIK